MTPRLDRRSFMALAGGATVVLGAAAASRWRTRRALIRLGLTRAPANRLRNAGFLQCTIPGIPDYWGTPAPADVPDARGLMQVVDDAVFPRVRALRLSTTSARPPLSVHSMKTFVPAPRAYTFSVYLRCSGAVDASLSLGWTGPKPIHITREWQRYELSHTPALEAGRDDGLSVGIYVSGQGAVDIAAPQLEEGDRATAFDFALADDRPLPVAAWPEIDRDVIAPRSSSAAVGRSLSSTGPAVTFGIALHDPGERQLDDIASRGFNTVVLFVPVDVEASGEEENFSQMRSTFDTAHQRGLRVIACLTSNATLDARRRASVRAVDGLKDHPAVLAWMIFDEPSKHWIAPPWQELEALYRAVKTADAGHAAFINDNAWSGDTAAVRVRSTDVASIDVYPVGSVQNPLAVVAALARAINVDTIPAGGRPSAFWLQLYGWNDASREPTVSEARAMAYLAFIWGTRTFLYWTYKPMQPTLWDAMGTLRNELATLDRTLSSANCRWVRAGTSGTRVHYTMWQGDGRAYVIACNASSEPVFVTFDVMPLVLRGAARPWHDEVRSQVAGDKLNAWFGPYGREVFEMRAAS